MLNRRDAIRGLAFSASLAASGLAGRAFAAAPAALAWTPKALTVEQARIVDAAAELIMPATDTPGAREAGVPQFIDRALGDYLNKDQAQRLRDGLARMDADARAAHGAGFAALTPAQQIALLVGYEREAVTAGGGVPGGAHFFTAFEDLVTVGYFTSEPGATKALAYDPIPGAYHGCVPLAELGRGWATR